MSQSTNNQDKKMSQSTNNQDKKMSQGGDSTTEWDTPLRDGESKNVPLPYNLNLLKQEIEIFPIILIG